MNISTKKTEVLCLSKNQCTLQVYTPSERQYTATGNVQAPWGGIHVWRKAEQGNDTRIG